jgi:hypothetical protein
MPSYSVVAGVVLERREKRLLLTTTTNALHDSSARFAVKLSVDKMFDFCYIPRSRCRHNVADEEDKC